MRGVVRRLASGGLMAALAMPAAGQTTYPGQPGGPQIQPTRPDRPRPPRPDRPRPPRPPVVIVPPRPPIVQPGYGAVVRCESYNYRFKRCAADTRGGVAIARRIAGDCRRGNWGYDRRSIFVDNGCRADFRVAGYGGGYPQPGGDRDRGPSTGAVIAGVAVAGGLLALLASNAKTKREAAAAAESAPQTYPPGPPAALVADLAALPAAARPSVQTCLFDAARQFGVTGGSRIAFDRAEELLEGNGGWRLRTTLLATYPDGERDVPIYCRATPTRIVELIFG